MEPDHEGEKWKEFSVAIAEEAATQVILDAETTQFDAPAELHWAALLPDGLSTSGRNDNEDSLVLLLRYGVVGFLFTGDIETIDADAVARWKLPGILVLKAPHHGRTRSATLALVDRFHPELVIVSTKDCVPETSDAIAQLGIPLFSTSTSGTIHVSTDGESVWVTTDTLSDQIIDCSEE